LFISFPFNKQIPYICEESKIARFFKALISFSEICFYSLPEYRLKP
jgi:hypothetical protein